MGNVPSLTTWKWDGNLYLEPSSIKICWLLFWKNLEKQFPKHRSWINLTWLHLVGNGLISTGPEVNIWAFIFLTQMLWWDFRYAVTPTSWRKSKLDFSWVLCLSVKNSLGCSKNVGLRRRQAWIWAASIYKYNRISSASSYCLVSHWTGSSRLYFISSLFHSLE